MDYPDFGQYMEVHAFKAFVSAAPYCWCDKKYWFADKSNKTWDIFLPCLKDYNNNRTQLIIACMLLLDKSMSGWCPHTSQFGRLQNLSWEPRKPVSLGTMFRNGVECVIGIVIHQDVVQPPEVEAKKEFYGSISRFPTKQEIGATTATVMHQIKGASVPEGRWVGGDGWFGSAMTRVEVMKAFGVHSTWIIKNNQSLYPYKALRAVLKARFGDCPAGHWVVMKTVISEVPMFALAYAWSQSGVSYFLSTCGTTNPSPPKYETSFEDDFGVAQYRQVERPYISHFYMILCH